VFNERMLIQQTKKTSRPSEVNKEGACRPKKGKEKGEGQNYLKLLWNSASQVKEKDLAETPEGKNAGKVEVGARGIPHHRS